MNNVREKAIAAICSRDCNTVETAPAVDSIRNNYASDVFNIDQMQKILAPEVFQKMLKTVKNREPLDPSIADDVAKAMKDWAASKGATHYTHWFQPLNGTTAEKHDAFLNPTPMITTTLF